MVGGFVKESGSPREQGSGTRMVPRPRRKAYRRIFYLAGAVPGRDRRGHASSGQDDVLSRLAAWGFAHRARRRSRRHRSRRHRPSGLREKDVTLDIAHLAAPVLSRELGIPTLLTRDDDRLVPLDERAARANAFHADLFVSIHCNARRTAARTA